MNLNRCMLISIAFFAIFFLSFVNLVHAQGPDSGDLVLAAVQAPPDGGSGAQGQIPRVGAAGLGETEAGHDPWEPSGIIPSGPFKGRKVDTTHVRSVRLLSASESAPFDPAPGERLVANVQHRGRWWIARIPAGAVEDVIVHREDIPGGLGHGQLRFRTKPGLPVTLLPQAPGDSGSPVALTDFIFTCDGTAPIGVTRAEPLGGLEQYVVAYRMMSLEDKLLVMRTGGKLHTVAQWKLDISDDEKQAVLDQALATGSTAGMTRMFSLAGHNCTSEMLRILDASLHYDRLHTLAAHLSMIGVPRLIPLYLHERGLDGPGVKIPDLGVEIGETPR